MKPIIFGTLLLLVSTTAFGDSILQNAIIKLNSLNFNKMIKNFHVTVIKFDDYYARGPKQNLFEALSFHAADQKNVLVAEFGVREYGERENRELAEKYGATRDKLPMVVMFVKNKETKKLQQFNFPDEDEFTVENLKNFIKEHSGVHVPAPGCLEKFDLMAENMMKETKKETREKILEEAEKAMLQIKAPEDFVKANDYVKIMRKVAKGGEAYITKEVERINKLLAGKLSAEKKFDMEKRLNVVNSFKVKTPPKEEL